MRTRRGLCLICLYVRYIKLQVDKFRILAYGRYRFLCRTKQFDGKNLNFLPAEVSFVIAFQLFQALFLLTDPVFHRFEYSGYHKRHYPAVCTGRPVKGLLFCVLHREEIIMLPYCREHVRHTGFEAFDKPKQYLLPFDDKIRRNEYIFKFYADKYNV